MFIDGWLGKKKCLANKSFAGGIVNEIVNFHCHSGNASMDDMDAAVQVVVHQLREKTH